MMKDLLAPKYSLEYLGASKSALMIYDCQNAYKQTITMLTTYHSLFSTWWRFHRLSPQMIA